MNRQQKLAAALKTKVINFNDLTYLGWVKEGLKTNEIAKRAKVKTCSASSAVSRLRKAGLVPPLKSKNPAKSAAVKVKEKTELGAVLSKMTQLCSTIDKLGKRQRESDKRIFELSKDVSIFMKHPHTTRVDLSEPKDGVVTETNG